MGEKGGFLLRMLAQLVWNCFLKSDLQMVFKNHCSYKARPAGLPRLSSQFPKPPHPPLPSLSSIQQPSHLEEKLMLTESVGQRGFHDCQSYECWESYFSH